ncbi:MAG: DUF4388 domain-containing protein [Pyrinomonadaceae bacterium]
MSNRLGEIPLAEILREIVSDKVSGALRLARDRARAVVYARDGATVHAVTNLRQHRLVESLRRWRALRAEVLDVIVTDAMPDAEAGAALLSAGVCTRQELDDFTARQAGDALRTLLLWADGEWSFDPRARPTESAHARIELRPMFLESARRFAPELASARMVDDEEIIRPAPVQGEQLKLLPAEAFVLSRVVLPLRLGELCAVSGLPEAQTRQHVYALALAGLLERAAWPRVLTNAPPPRVEAAPAITPSTIDIVPSAPPATEKVGLWGEAGTEDDPRAEIDALLTLAASPTYYEMFRVEPDAGLGEIKRAYYAFAKRFHPDRFMRKADEQTRARVEQAFGRLAQAYETLKEDQTRAAYDRTLSGAGAGMAGTHGPTPSAAPVVREAHPGGPAMDAESAENFFRQGLTAAEGGRHAVAASLLAQAVQLRPKEARYHAHYGHALARDPHTRRQAESELRAAVMLDGQNASYRVMLAELYQALGHLRRAEAELERALAADPQSTAARAMLGRLRERR